MGMLLNAGCLAVLAQASHETLSAQADEPLVGTWALVAVSSRTSTGERDDIPYGAHPTGFLTYTAEGRMSAIISYGERKPLSLADRHAAPMRERADAFASFLAYAGRYTLAGDTVIHHVEAASVQNWVGTDLVRVARLQSDRITLRTPPVSVGGQLRTVELTWKRLR